MCMIIVVQFLLGMMVVSWEIENKTYAKFWGRNFILGKVKVADSPQKHSQKSLGTLKLEKEKYTLHARFFR